jgi:hypothetical protein
MERNDMLISSNCRIWLFDISEHFAQKHNCFSNLRQQNLTQESKDHKLLSKLSFMNMSVVYIL